MQGEIWKNKSKEDFMERFEDFGLKIGIYRCLKDTFFTLYERGGTHYLLQ